jgi:hypothetical protein
MINYWYDLKERSRSTQLASVNIINKYLCLFVKKKKQIFKSQHNKWSMKGLYFIVLFIPFLCLLRVMHLMRYVLTYIYNG